jgi:hypothetical protein
MANEKKIAPVTGVAAYVRRVLKKARMSAANSSGSSAAAKWPPRGISVQR